MLEEQTPSLPNFCHLTPQSFIYGSCKPNWVQVTLLGNWLSDLGRGMECQRCTQLLRVSSVRDICYFCSLSELVTWPPPTARRFGNVEEHMDIWQAVNVSDTPSCIWVRYNKDNISPRYYLIFYLVTLPFSLPPFFSLLLPIAITVS